MLTLMAAALLLSAQGAAATRHRRLADGGSTALPPGEYDPDSDPYTMFVQLATGAELAPKEGGGDNDFTLTLDGTSPLVLSSATARSECRLRRPVCQLAA